MSPTPHPVQCILKDPSLRIKQPRHRADHSQNLVPRLRMSRVTVPHPYTWGPLYLYIHTSGSCTDVSKGSTVYYHHANILTQLFFIKISCYNKANYLHMNVRSKTTCLQSTNQGGALPYNHISCHQR
jgi:hypothetical protein